MNELQQRCEIAHTALCPSPSTTIVPSHDKGARPASSPTSLASTTQHGRPLRSVHVNDSLTLDWDNRDQFEGHHYAFLVDDQAFDQIFGRIKDQRIVYGSGPGSHTDGQINHRLGGRGLYYADPDGHLMEIMTRA